MMVWFVALALAFGSPQARQLQPQQSQAIAATRGPVQPNTDYIHGTVDVIISTRDGFVLAADSRITHGDGTHTDDGQKLFTVGNRTACVIAGTVGAEIGLDGFDLRDAVGSHLLSMDKVAKENPGFSPNAVAVAHGLLDAFGGVAGLWRLTPGVVPGLVGEASAVSVGQDGEPGWMTLYLPLAPQSANGVSFLTVGTPGFGLHSLLLGLRFNVEVLGQPDVANRLLAANKPGEDVFSRTAIMRRFYLFKLKRRLDDLRLADGIELARTLEEATIALAPAAAGVGGPVDILTLSEAGYTWIQRKEKSAPLPPPWAIQFIGNRFIGGRQGLDGLQCLGCSFTDVDLTYNGDGDVELIQPKFDGSCRLRLGPHASEKMPHTVAALENLLRGKCEITGSSARP